MAADHTLVLKTDILYASVLTNTERRAFILAAFSLFYAVPQQGQHGKNGGPKMPRQPLAEVFGFPIKNMTKEAVDGRSGCLCPFGNKVPECTKDKKDDPLGVCSIFADADDGEIIITCPIRFREGWIVAKRAAEFFFPAGTEWKILPEVRLKDAEGGSAGNIDVVLAALNSAGKVVDFGALEIQAVYISGNVRNPFAYYMKDPATRQNMDWSSQPLYPRADYLSSSRKRLAPQLIFKGGILKSWGKKTAVALNTGFFNTLPELDEVPKEKAEVAWFVYDLVADKGLYKLKLAKSVYTKFNESLTKITTSQPGDVKDFVEVLQNKVNET